MRLSAIAAEGREAGQSIGIPRVVVDGFVDVKREVEAAAADPRLVGRYERGQKVARVDRREGQRFGAGVLDAGYVEDVFDEVREVQHFAKNRVFDLVALLFRQSRAAALERLRAEARSEEHTSELQSPDHLLSPL